MVALDGRESMRGILRDAGLPHEDPDLREFKALVANNLGPVASALLCDTHTGDLAIKVTQTDQPLTGLIVAVDHFTEPRFGPLKDSHLDQEAVQAAGGITGLNALKLFIFWRPDESPQSRQADAQGFVDACRDLGVLSILEGVITVPVDDPAFDDALVRAADEFSRYSPSVYKTQMPTLGTGDPERIERESARVTDAIGAPWVVLSNGVPDGAFVSGVAASCRGGASGFLAGRGAWRPAVTAPNPAQELATEGRRRLAELSAVVDSSARPWRNAANA